jgi:hypothetical protein
MGEWPISFIRIIVQCPFTTTPANILLLASTCLSIFNYFSTIAMRAYFAITNFDTHGRNIVHLRAI